MGTSANSFSMRLALSRTLVKAGSTCLFGLKLIEHLICLVLKRLYECLCIFFLLGFANRAFADCWIKRITKTLGVVMEVRHHALEVLITHPLAA
jgi:hypothetical protein